MILAVRHNVIDAEACKLDHAITRDTERAPRGTNLQLTVTGSIHYTVS